MIEEQRGGKPSDSVSVVVPTFNRKRQLMRTIESLSSQTFDGEMEIIVVSDGSTDGTVEQLAALDCPVRLRVLHQDNAGPAAARNVGIQAAKNDLVVMIDDDIVAAPDLIEQHVRAHAAVADASTVIIGPMLTPDDVVLEPWVAWEQEMLYKQYDAFATSPEASFRQFYTGNASLRRSHLVDAGGFDERFRRAEDIELAFRLWQAGLRFRFCPDAKSYHYAERSFASWRSIARDYGSTTVIFGRERQPFLLENLATEFSERNTAQHRVIRALLRSTRSGPVAMSGLRAVRRVASGLGLARLASHLMSLDWATEFYRGAAEELGSIDELFQLIDRRGVDPTRFAARFVLEQTLGHVTHTDNLRVALRHRVGLELDEQLVKFDTGPMTGRIPGWSNWTVRAGVRARRALRRATRRNPSLRIDVMFVHTQVPAVLLGRWMTRVPTVVSLDATPAQYDALGESYAHETGSAPAERLKAALNRRCFRQARHLVTWSAWTRDGLVADYGVPAERITVIPPGVNPDLWVRTTPRPIPDQTPIGVLFVGGDLERKGGHLLIEAAARLRLDASVPPFEVHLVTKSSVEAGDGVVLHDALTPNSPELITLYHSCEIFCLPTLGDCLPMVLAEAGAAGHALVSTHVGAIHEIVRDGVTGRLLQPGSVDDIERALRELLTDAPRRRRYGDAARSLVLAEHDAKINAQRLVELLAAVTDRVLPADWADPRELPD